MLNKDPNTASDFHDMLAQEVPIQLPGFGLNWQMDSTGEKRQTQTTCLSVSSKTLSTPAEVE